MRAPAFALRSACGVALVLLIAGCAGDDPAGPTEPSVADLAGLWMGSEFSITSNANPMLKADLVAMGGNLSWAIQASGSFSGTAVLPGLILGQQGMVTVPLSGVMRLLDDTRLRVDFVPEIPPVFTAFTAEYTVGGNVLTIRDPASTYDFDGDGVGEPATVFGSFTKN